jgi:diaminopimelate decarboxylase
MFFLPQAEKNAVFVADWGVLMRQHVRWRTHMPQMRPFYAVQANSSLAVIEILAALGTGFICTSKVPAALSPTTTIITLYNKQPVQIKLHFSVD